MIEQNARRALAMADRGYVLEGGKNRFEGTGRGAARPTPRWPSSTWGALAAGAAEKRPRRRERPLSLSPG